MKTGGSDYVFDETKKYFETALKMCPTLQIYMWQARFPDGAEQPRTFPFSMDAQKPNHSPEGDESVVR